MKKKRGGTSSSDSLETMRLKRDFLEGIEEPEEFPLGTRAEEWLPEEIEGRLYKEIVGENEEWINNPHSKFYTKECSGLKEYCELFPKTCYFNPKYLERVKICQYIPYTCIRDSIRSIRNLDRYLNNRDWNNFFEREFYEYLSNGLAILDMSNYFANVFIEVCDEIFSSNIPNYELDISLRDLFTLLNQKSNKELSDIFLEILEELLKDVRFEEYYENMRRRMEEPLIQRQIKLKLEIKKDFCDLMELLTLGSEITTYMIEGYVDIYQ
jgi:hypothetical protein